MREVVLGTAGHVDHGKTSLVRALTGIDTDRLKEEKERGITIELGFAYLDLECGHRLGIVDVPGHERFVKNMVAGAAGIDLVAFVIAADEGIMPQTREHFEICTLLGVKQGLVVITKKDMVEEDWLELVTEEIQEFFVGSFLENAPVVKVSSTTGEGIDAVRETIDRIVGATDFTEAYGPFRLPVDRVFTMKGYGTVITGTSISGRIRVGDDVMIYPRQLEARIRGIQVHAKDVEEVEAGNRTAINLQGVDREVISRGDLLASANTLKPSYMLDAEFQYLSGNTKNLKNRKRVRVHLGTAEIMGRIVILDQEELAPGDLANVQILLEETVGVWPGDHYVVRNYSPVFTIGGGMIFNGSPPKRRRFREVNKEIFLTYRSGTEEDKILQFLRESKFSGVTEAELSVKMGLFGKRLKKVLELPLSARRALIFEPETRRMIEAQTYQGLVDRSLAVLGDFHRGNPLKPGPSKEELRARINPALGPKLYQYLLNDLTKHGAVVQAEAVVRLAGHEISVKEDEKNLRDDMEQLYLESGLKVPSVKELMAHFSG
ncbi:selenocysteine-specific translation elongation factor, partial [Thermodesulfobacteriota bacterium]